MTVSIYKNVADTEGRNADLFKILTTNKWQHLTDKVRAETNKTKRNLLKQQLLPAFTPSGVFRKNERNNEGLVKHSGYMCIDIDGDDNPNIDDWQSVVFELGKLPQIAFAGLSASGNGVFAIIPIKYPDKHKEHFEAFQKSFAKRGLIIDPKCGNVSRLRFYSYNEHYYINKNAEPYTLLYRQPQIVKPIKPYSTNIHLGESDVDALVREIVTMGINIVPDYDTWFNVGSALSNVSNGRELFHRISQVDSSKYNYKKCDRQFDNLKPGKGITINTLFYVAEKHGVTLKRRYNSQPTLSSQPLKADKYNHFVNWREPKSEEKQSVQTPQPQVEEPTPADKTLDCFVDNDGKVYIPSPCNDDTFSVHKSIEQYNSHKGLPTIVDKDEVDTSQMSKRYIDLKTLLIS